MSGTVLDAVLNEFNERIEAISRALIDGSAKDYAEYRSMCGEVRGLSLARAHIADLVRKLESFEDE
jgi:hypothetical protein